MSTSISSCVQYQRISTHKAICGIPLIKQDSFMERHQGGRQSRRSHLKSLSKSLTESGREGQGV